MIISMLGEEDRQAERHRVDQQSADESNHAERSGEQNIGKDGPTPISIRTLRDIGAEIARSDATETYAYTESEHEDDWNDEVEALHVGVRMAAYA